MLMSVCLETAAAAPQSGEDDLMQQALSLSLGQKPSMNRDISSMTEEEQLHYALQMSMSNSASETASASTTEKQTTPVDAEMKDVITNRTLKFMNEVLNRGHWFFVCFFVLKDEDDYAKAMNDPEFLQRVISSLPGVDPNSDAIRSAVENLTKDGKEPEKKDEEKKWLFVELFLILILYI